MTNLFIDFMRMTTLEQCVFIFWSVCVVMFYIVVMYIVVNLLFNLIKRLF
jgi:hypothetical protein